YITEAIYMPDERAEQIIGLVALLRIERDLEDVLLAEIDDTAQGRRKHHLLLIGEIDAGKDDCAAQLKELADLLGIATTEQGFRIGPNLGPDPRFQVRRDERHRP